MSNNSSNRPATMMPGRRRGPMPMGKPDVKIDAKTVKRMLTYLKPFRFRLIFVFVCIVLSAITGVVSSVFLRTLIDDYIAPLLLQASPDFSGLLRAIGIMACIYLVGVVSGFAYNCIMATVSQGALHNIRSEMFAHMQKLPIKYYDQNANGDIMSRYTNDANALRQMLSQTLPVIISSTVTVVSIFFAMLSNSVWLTVFVLVCVFFILKIATYIGSNSGKFFVKQQKSMGDVNGYVEEMISGQKVVKVFCHEDKTKEEFDRRNEELCDNMTTANKFANVMGPIFNNMGHLLYVVLATVGGAMAISGVPNLSLTGFGVLTLGMLASFLQLSKSFIHPISQLSNEINSVMMALAGAQRIFALLDEKPEEDNGYVTLVSGRYNENGEFVESSEKTGTWAWKHPHSDGTLTYTKLKGEVRFYDVDFAYVEGKTVLHDISLWAEPGQKIAFVGATGAGKTTITNLINRFYDLADGKVRYDGININKIRKSDLRRSLGVVLQDVNLFTGTVMENIRYGRLDATDEECIAAAKLANADGFIRMLPNGYDTVLSGDGSGLSQGQRQLISIARAAVADPPVMILDEATSSIDTRTEAIVQRGMDALMKGRTVFVIAHRLSTVKNSDVIMVLDHGRIIERGNHEKLIAEKGTYYQLYTGAFELE